MAIPPWADISIRVGSQSVTRDVIFAETSFSLAATAQPGTCTIVLRENSDDYSLTEGSIIELKIWSDYYGDDKVMWKGYLMDVEEGYEFDADAGDRKWTLHGVDLNILFDKLVMYNHAHPNRYPNGGGAYRRRRVVENGKSQGWITTIPRYTYDGEYIKTMMADFDLGLISPTIKYSGSANRIENVGQFNPDGSATPPSAGVTLRDFMIDVARNVQRSQPGSVIWYIDPAGYLVYKAQDTDVAPFWVGDGDPAQYIGGVQGENVRSLRYQRGISSIKNDVIVWAGDLDPRPSSRQDKLLYKHKINQSSVDTYGRFQHSETLNSRWTQQAVNARATKVLNQEGIPGGSASFVTYRHGLYPGQLIWVNMEAHSRLVLLPIRQINMRFINPTAVEYTVTCSYDTQDPWGLLLALKQPPNRGLVQPPFDVLDLRSSNADLRYASRFDLVKEYPISIGGNRYQCSYGYIRDSLSVFVGGLRRVSLPDVESGTVGFIQQSPANGRFKLAENPGSSRVYVEYHLSRDL